MEPKNDRTQFHETESLYECSEVNWRDNSIKGTHSFWYSFVREQWLYCFNTNVFVLDEYGDDYIITGFETAYRFYSLL